MALVGEKLASDATLDKVLCICSGRRPIETCTEGLADKYPGCGVVPAETGVNFFQELPPSSSEIHLSRTPVVLFL